MFLFKEDQIIKLILSGFIEEAKEELNKNTLCDIFYYKLLENYLRYLKETKQVKADEFFLSIFKEKLGFFIMCCYIIIVYRNVDILKQIEDFFEIKVDSDLINKIISNYFNRDFTRITTKELFIFLILERNWEPDVSKISGSFKISEEIQNCLADKLSFEFISRIENLSDKLKKRFSQLVLLKRFS